MNIAGREGEMPEQKYTAEVDRPSARRRPSWRRRLLIAVLCVVIAVAGLYSAWSTHRARLLSDLTKEYEHSSGQFPRREFRASGRSVSGRGIAITDEIAGAIGSQRTISAIDFSACAISSDGLRTITSLPNLNDLNLVDCHVTGPGRIRFGTSQSLIVVTLTRTNVAGSDLAQFLSEQPHLETLVLDRTSITDSDLEGWKASTELIRAVFQEPQLTRATLGGLTRCQSLEALSLASSGIDDDGLVNFARLGSLTSLDLANCRALDGRGLAYLAPLSELANLDLSGTQVTDRGLESLRGGFPALSQVQLRDCGRITDAVFESLARLPRLRQLDLTGTKVTGRGLRFLDGHKMLGTLILTQTELDDDGFSTLGRLPALMTLNLSRTRIAGGTLARLKNCPRLETLSIAGCNLAPQWVQSLISATPPVETLDCTGCAAVDDEAIEALRRLPHLQTVECGSTRVFDSWNRFGTIRVKGGPNGLEIARTNAEITEAAASDLNHGGTLRLLTLDHCRLSANALKIATSSPALRTLMLNDCTILDKGAGHLGALERLESLTIRDTPVDAADLGRVCSGRRLREFVLEGSTIGEAPLSTWTGARLAHSIAIKGAHFGGKRLRGLRNCEKLQVLDLSNSDVSDGMLQDVQGLSALGAINLAGCKQVTGGGLAYLAGLPQLRSLDLTGTGITGHGLVNLKPCKNLSQLNLSETKLTDGSIAAAEFPPSLNTLSVAKTDIHGSGLASLCKIKWFNGLNASNSSVDDEGLKTIATIPKLWSLDLSHCARITDAGVRRLATMPNLGQLNLCGTKTTDAALDAIAAMPNLRTLNLRETQVTAQGVRKLSSSPSLTMVDADERTAPQALLREILRRGRAK